MDNGTWRIKCLTCKNKWEPSPLWKYCPYCGIRVNVYSGKPERE